MKGFYRFFCFILYLDAKSLNGILILLWLSKNSAAKNTEDVFCMDRKIYGMLHVLDHYSAMLLFPNWMEENTKIFVAMIKQIGEIAYSNHILQRRFCGSSKNQTEWAPKD